MCLESDPVAPFLLLPLWWEHHLSHRLFRLPPHLYPPSPIPPYCLFSIKHRSDSLKNLRPGQSSLLPLPLLLGVPPGSSCSVSALAPLILTQLCSPGLLACPEHLGHPPCDPCTRPSLYGEQPLQVCLSPSSSPDLLTPPLSRALTPQCGLTSLLYSPPP